MVYFSILARAELLPELIQGFNPRPRRGAGATHACPGWCFLCDVSILARAEARALRAGFGLMAGGYTFQSSPAPRRGRYAIAATASALACSFQSSPAPRRGRYEIDHLIKVGDLGFNPRPRRGAGATRKNGSSRRIICWFQSSPAPRRGRYRAPAFVDLAHWCFNPRPRRGAGATGRQPLLTWHIGVSILARAEARALPSHHSPSPDSITGFNPRARLGVELDVSILARAEARALLKL